MYTVEGRRVVIVWLTTHGNHLFLTRDRMVKPPFRLIHPPW